MMNREARNKRFDEVAAQINDLCAQRDHGDIKKEEFKEQYRRLRQELEDMMLPLEEIKCYGVFD